MSDAEPTTLGPSSERTRRAVACAAIVAATLAAYIPSIRNGFVWNDSDYVTRSDLQSLAGLRRIWFDMGATEQYYPVLHTAFWIEHRIWSDAAWAYHLFNVLLHATSACLLYAVLLQLRNFPSGNSVAAGSAKKTKSGAGQRPLGFEWLAALLYALHPLCVESVAWISEQKNTLSTGFYFGAALAFFSFRTLTHEAGGRPGHPLSESAKPSPVARYSLGTILFVLALLTKSVTATLPAALLVIIWWKEGRLRWKLDWAPLLPWLGASAAMGFLTHWVERTYVIGEGTAKMSLSLAARCLVAGRAAWFYLGKMIWPHPLIFFYPAWTIDPHALLQWIWPLATIGVIGTLWRLRGRSRGPLALALLFVGALVPALGFFDVYAFRFSFVADHFAYLACPIFCAASAAGLCALAVRARHWTTPAIACVVALYGTLTWIQCRVYHDPESFYRAILKQNPNSWIAHNNLGNWLADKNDLNEAIGHYRAALAIKPDYAEAENDLGVALGRIGRMQEAIGHYESAVRLNPYFERAICNLGRALLGLGRNEEAAAQLENALRLRPDDSEALGALAPCLYGLGRIPEAIVYYENALRLSPEDPGTLNNLGGLLLAAGRTDEAVARFRRSIALDRDFPQSHANLAAALASQGHADDAAAEAREASRLQDAHAHGR